MKQQPGLVFGLLLIAGGMLLAAISAFVPHYYTGYRLDIGILSAGLLPWLVYAFALVYRPGALTLAAGAALLAAHIWLLAAERFSTPLYADNTIYLAPLIFSILLLPLAVSSAWRAWRAMMSSHRKAA